MKNFIASLGAAAATLFATAAFADQPKPWQTDLQEAATPIMHEIRWFEQYTLWFIVPITLLVLALLIWVGIRYRASSNPNPSRTSHNTLIEVIWTVGPVVILLFLAVPSFNLLTAQYTPPEEPKLTIKATGYQWYWGYEYQTGDNPLSFDSVLMKEGDRAAMGKEDKDAYPRLLAVDNEIVVPVNTTVRLLVTAADVLHSFAMPAFGVKADAVPGRINQSWFKAEREGLYYGQCSELCGKDHAFMPIAFRVVSQERYDSWLEAARGDLAGANKALMASIAAENKIASAGN
ncbi:MAG: cytochrome c oxidase subunit II [Notoacmeibacter sp.]|nr:cytochrome c oxidase subunit II [Notoacmeibacter sp.]MCC0033021.1 cytochrome c oxidase subunit II [Brucellaceae bacterium]